MEESKVTINMSKLEKEIKELVDDFKFGLEMLFDNVEDYIKVEQDLKEEDNTKFKVGDVITGKDANGYHVTTKDSVLVVTDIFGPDDIKVKVLAHKLYFDEVGEEYEVHPEEFTLITDILWESD